MSIGFFEKDWEMMGSELLSFYPFNEVLFTTTPSTLEMLGESPGVNERWKTLFFFKHIYILESKLN